MTLTKETNHSGGRVVKQACMQGRRERGGVHGAEARHASRFSADGGGNSVDGDTQTDLPRVKTSSGSSSSMNNVPRHRPQKQTQHHGVAVGNGRCPRQSETDARTRRATRRETDHQSQYPPASRSWAPQRSSSRGASPACPPRSLPADSTTSLREKSPVDPSSTAEKSDVRRNNSPEWEEEHD